MKKLFVVFLMVLTAQVWGQDYLVVDPANEKIELILLHGEYYITIDENPIRGISLQLSEGNKLQRALHSAKNLNQLVQINFEDKSFSIEDRPATQLNDLNICLARKEMLEQIMTNFMTNQSQASRSQMEKAFSPANLGTSLAIPTLR